MDKTILENVKVTLHNAATAAGSSDITPSAGIDMAGFTTCAFLVPFGTITASAVSGIRVQQSDDDGSSDAYSDLADSASAVADSDDNKVATIEIVKPEKRYLKLIVDRATANAVVGEIFALQGGATEIPVTQPATTIGNEIHLTPAEGTA